MTVYLTGADNPGVRAIAKAKNIGLLVTPDTKQYASRLPDYSCWASDNGMFGLARRHQEDQFEADQFYGWLDSLPRTALFVAAPDVLHFVAIPGVKGYQCKVHDVDEVPIGDARATLDVFEAHAKRIRALGFKVALVGQDGVETMLDEIPWDLADAVFLGGSDTWKLGSGARRLVAAAKARGLHAHMGRVNSYIRLTLASDFGCDTVDGTFLAYGPDANLPRLLSWITGLDVARLQATLEFS